MSQNINDYSPIERIVRRYEADNTFARQDWQKDVKVSVVVTTYNQEDQLRKQLLALSQQTYDSSNFEVIVVDDGGKKGTGSSLDHVVKQSFPFDIKYVWQPDKGFRAAKAKNEAMKRASYETIISVDCDMIVNHQYIEDVMKWHYAAKQAGTNIVTIQDRAFVEPENMSTKAIRERRLDQVKKSPSRRFGTYHDWRVNHYKQSDRLKNVPVSIRDPVYYIGSTFSGGNCSFSKADAFEAGLFDESFTSYGWEDTEFGVRLKDYFERIGKRRFFIPVNTLAYHIEHGKNMEAQKSSASTKHFQRKLREARARPIPNFPKVSVFITIYNREQFIEQCIFSVMNQSFQDFEICICDDGSTDKTPKLLKELKNKYNQDKEIIKIITHKKNKGIAAAYTSAIKLCKGEYIAQLDSDDLLYKDALKTISEFLDKNKEIGLIFSDCNVLDINRNILFKWNGFERRFDINNNEKLKHHLFNDAMIINHFRMFRKDFLKNVKIKKDLNSAVDYDLYIKIAEKTKIAHLPIILYLYRLHKTNVSLPKFSLGCNPFQQANATLVKAQSARRRLKKLNNKITK